jgi:ATP/maltotriose-dependent transcriptional regulator MalT
MTKFKWGNMDQPGVYLDETILRQTKNFRNIFYRLAEQLVREGKKDSAIKALDYCQKVLPSKTIAHDVFSVRLAEGYFLAGSADKANALLREILNTCETKAKYYKTFRSSSKYKLVKPELEENIQIMTYCMQVAQMNQQEAVAKEFTDKLNAISSGL